MGICASKGNLQISDNDFEPEVDQFIFSKLDIEAVNRIKSILKTLFNDGRKISMSDLFMLGYDQLENFSVAERRLIQIQKEKNEKRKIFDFNIIDNTQALIQQFDQEANSPQKYVLVIGITGHGKSTFINSFANFLSGHYQLEDNLRTRLIIPPQQNLSAGSVTKEISAYRQNFNNEEIILIDTPGLRDTKGSEEDTIIVDQISKQIEKMRRLDLICIVSESSQDYIIKNNTLSDNQLCIARVLRLFGKSIASKMVHILTFSDFGSLKFSNFTDDQSLFKIQMDNIAPLNRASYFYQFQNSVTYCKDTGLIERLQFGRNLSQYKKLFQKLTDDFTSNNQGNEDNLQDTHEVIKTRAEETLTIDVITQQLGVYNEIQKNIVENQRKLQRAQSDMEQSQNFSYVQKVPFVEERECEQNYYVTNCRRCSLTCHSKCEYNDDENKKNCFMMKSKRPNSKPQCVICDHDWDEHKNSRIIYYVVQIDQTFTFDDMKKRYDKALTAQEIYQKEWEREHTRGTENKQKIKQQLDQLRTQIQQLYDSVLFKINHNQNTQDQILSKFPKYKKFIEEIEAELNQHQNMQSA